MEHGKHGRCAARMDHTEAEDHTEVAGHTEVADHTEAADHTELVGHAESTDHTGPTDHTESAALQVGPQMAPTSAIELRAPTQLLPVQTRVLP